MAEKKQKTAHAAELLRFYRAPAFTAHASRTLLSYLRAHLGGAAGVEVQELKTEYCFYVETKADAAALSAADQETLHWLLSETFEPQQTRPDVSFLEVIAGRSLSALKAAGCLRVCREIVAISDGEGGIQWCAGAVARGGRPAHELLDGMVQ